MNFEGFPLIIGWELTLACNIRCHHCGSSAALPRRNELTLEEALRISEQFPELLVQEVNFTGGEPLMNPHWWKIALHLRNIGITTKILTNGLMLRPNLISTLRETGIAGVGVSIDGKQETHDYIRGFTGLFQQSIAGIQRVLEVGIPVTVITTVNAINITELLVLFNLLLEIGVQAWQVQPIFPLGRGRFYDELHLSKQSYLALGEFIKEVSPVAEKSRMKLLPGDSFGYYTELDTRIPPWKGCSAGLTACGITSDGRIKGCLSMPDELAEGDLRNNDLWEIWFDPNAFKYNRKPSFDDLGENCKGCDKSEECLGGCSAMSYGVTGRLHNDPYCFYRFRKDPL